MKMVVLVAIAASVLSLGAETYHVRRDGMENARVDLKANRSGYQWLSFAAYSDSWWKKGSLTDYPKQIEEALKALYGGSPRCNKTGYPKDLWWAQYRPGGRVSSTHTVAWDSNILKDAAKDSPKVAALQFEVIIRQAMAYNPRQSLLVVHGDDPEVVAEYKAGREPLTVRIAEKVAAHYGLPTLNLAKAAAEKGVDGVKAAVTAFVNDVLDPSGVPATAVARKPSAPLANGLNAQCHVVTYDDGAVRKLGDWRQGVASPNPKYMSAIKPGKVGDSMEMEFRGTEVGFLDFSMRGGAEYAYRIDKGVWKRLPPSDGKELSERHLRLGTGLAMSGAVFAKSDAERHTVELKVVKAGEGVIVGFLLNGSTADEAAGGSRNIKTAKDIDRIAATMKPLRYTPPAGRHAFVPQTMKRLKEGPSLRIVCLGDSIISDTCKSKFELLLERDYPKCKVTAICSSRSATGCWWYKDEGRVDGWVFSHKPDLLIIGGVSQRDDVEAIRSVVRQCRAKDPALEILVMSPVFGTEGSSKEHAWNVGWNYDPDKAQHPFRRKLRDMCTEEKVAFFDINAPWRQYILDSGMDVGYYHRDGIHSNQRGQALVGKLIEKWFAADADVPFSRYRFDAGRGAPKLFYDAYRPIGYGSHAEIAIVLIHGWGGHVRTLLPIFTKALAARAGSDERTPYVIAPQFPRHETIAANKEPEDGRAVWCDSWADEDKHPDQMGSASDDWRGGGDANGTSFSSYDYIDAIFARFADRAKYPNLRKVVLAGFSAGGQFAGRYAATGKGVVRDGVKVVYIAMSPSTEFRFEPEQPWLYGLKGRPRYSAALAEADIMKNLCSRRVWRGCGSLDILGRPKTSLDMTPPAVAQGANRYERFRNFERYLDKYPEWKKQVSFHVFEGIAHKEDLCYPDPALLDFVFE